MPSKLADVLDRPSLRTVLGRLGAWRGTVILNYHRIAPAHATPAGDLWSASADQLDDQMRFLAKHVDVVGPEELLEGRRRPGRAVMLTFDDGYRDNFEIALPILRAHGLVATFFISTGFIDAPRVAWWDEIAWMVENASTAQLPRDEWLGGALDLGSPGARQSSIVRLVGRYEELGPVETDCFLDRLGELTGSGRADGRHGDVWMTWNMIRALLSVGMSVGGHTVNHPLLARLPLEDQRREIIGCRDRLAAELGIAMNLFAYPVGLRDTFDRGTVACLREAGVRLAFSFYGGYLRRRHTDWYDIPRTSVWLGMAPPRFRAVPTLPQVFARC